MEIKTSKKNNKNIKGIVEGSSFAIIYSAYYPEISANLVAGAKETLSNYSLEPQLISVTGALEIPPAISLLKSEFEGFIALGCVIRGETTHYELVCKASTMGLMDLGTQGLCIGNGIITVENLEQAMVRADKTKMDKGGHAARAAIELVALKQSILLTP